MATKNAKISVKQDPEAEVPVEILAKSIVEISEAMKKLMNGPLKRETILVLLHDYTALSKRDINAVLYGLEGLRKQYTTL